MIFKIKATIPVAAYGNLQPEIEVEAETYEEASRIALDKIEKLWDIYADKPLTKKAPGTQYDGFAEVETFTGEKILYNAETHEYTDLQGNHLVSGSEYKKSFDKPFDKAAILPRVEKKYGVPAETIDEMWTRNGEISTTFGTSIHLAMQQFAKHKDTGCDEKEYHLPKHPLLRNIVSSFPLFESGATILPEVMVSNVKEKMAGQIDGIVLTGEKECDVIDYKSDADIEKNIEGHFKQLSFYAKILALAGWKVNKIIVWNYTDGWKDYPSDVLEIIN